jgi:hypothetical protein
MKLHIPSTVTGCNQHSLKSPSGLPISVIAARQGSTVSFWELLQEPARTAKCILKVRFAQIHGR